MHVVPPLKRGVCLGLFVLVAMACSDPVRPPVATLDDPPRSVKYPTDGGPDGAVSSGGSDAGPIGPASGCGTYDPKKVYILGVLQEGDGVDSTADLATPDRFCSAIWSHDPGVVRPTDGKLLYIEWNVNKLRVFNPEALVYEKKEDGWHYVATPPADDPEIPSPCPSGASLLRFFVWPDTGKVVFGCANEDLDEAGKRVAPPFTRVVALGLAGRVLFTRSSQLYVTGGPTKVDAGVEADAGKDAGADAGLTEARLAFPVGTQVMASRARPDGFALVSRVSDGPIHLYHVDDGGLVADMGTYAAPPAGTSPEDFSSRLDSDENLYQIGRKDQDDLVVKVPLQGAASVVYTEANAPKEAPRWSGSRPTLYVKLHASSLLAGP